MLLVFVKHILKIPKIKFPYHQEYLKKIGKNKNAKYFNQVIEKRIAQLEEETANSSKGN
ncbi:hypothetical protein [Aquimarina celericrescens]|uniref:Uncharacterized protein n=1 Tax=Aquimarina celericrescens TaxID=1964542 RepID=A0ABW5AWY6_9FLAO|nr:hypothetical protein [Aquimarina celericrescens]